jgi:hypothetical protein
MLKAAIVTGRSSQAATVVLYLVGAILIISVCSTAPFDQNDHMYSAPLFLPGTLYWDIHFIQAPLTFYFLKCLAALAPDGLIYVTLRMSSIVLTASAVFLVAIYCFNRLATKAFFVTIAGTNFFLVSAAFEIGSYALPLFMLAISAVIAKIDWRGKLIYPAAFGAALGLAASAKLNHALFLLPGLYFVWFLKPDKGGRQVLAYFASYSVGAVFGLSPILVAFFKEPLAFLVHTVLFHSNFAYAWRGLNAVASIQSVISIVFSWMLDGGAALVALSSVSAIQTRTRRNNAYAQFILLMLLGAFAAAISLAVDFKQYYVPVSFFAVLGACLFFDLEDQRGLSITLAAVLISVLLTQNVGPPLQMLRTAYHKKNTIAGVVEINKAIQKERRNFVATDNCKPVLFTFSAAYAIDSGFTLSKFADAGILWPLVDGFVPSKYLDDPRYSVNKEMLRPDIYVDHEHIDFLLVGFYLDQPAEQRLIDWAKRNGYQLRTIDAPSDNNFHTIQLWYNPLCTKHLSSP